MGVVYRYVFKHLKFQTFQRLHKSYLKLYARQVYFHNIMQNFILTEGINQNVFFFFLNLQLWCEVECILSHGYLGYRNIRIYIPLQFQLEVECILSHGYLGYRNIRIYIPLQFQLEVECILSPGYIGYSLLEYQDIYIPLYFQLEVECILSQGYLRYSLLEYQDIYYIYLVFLA